MRIEAYGTVDELNSYIGLIRDQEIGEEMVKQLLEIQDRLFTLGSLLAADPGASSMKLPEIHAKDSTNLEEWIDAMEEQLEPMKRFILPGGHTTVSYCHIARCICRRAERLSVDLNQSQTVDPLILRYLNRLSDYLFVLSRKLTKDLDAIEYPWIPRN
jgi:cob(I)alamin adenosyltransferase